MAINAIQGVIGWSNLSSIGIGACCGAGEFLWHTLAQKVAMVTAKYEFRPATYPGFCEQESSLSPDEKFCKKLSLFVVKHPLLEESLFRGLLQPMIAYGGVLCFPQLAAPAIWGLSQASLLSIAMTAVGFGLCHYPSVEKGGIGLVTMATVAGTVFGVVRDKFGLAASIAAHMTTNFGTLLLDEYWVELLEFPYQKELRELLPKDRKLRFLQEAVNRANNALAIINDPEERKELEDLCNSWQRQIQELEDSTWTTKKSIKRGDVLKTELWKSPSS